VEAFLWITTLTCRANLTGLDGFRDLERGAFLLLVLRGAILEKYVKAAECVNTELESIEI
jgi:hypothetical protein